MHSNFYGDQLNCVKTAAPPGDEGQYLMRIAQKYSSISLYIDFLVDRLHGIEVYPLQRLLVARYNGDSTKYSLCSNILVYQFPCRSVKRDKS